MLSERNPRNEADSFHLAEMGTHSFRCGLQTAEGIIPKGKENTRLQRLHLRCMNADYRRRHREGVMKRDQGA
jgi:hypothetical protein